MRSAWVRALHESPEDAESLCAAQELPKSGCCATTAREPALPTAGCSRAGATVPPCPGAARPSSQLGRLPQDLRLPFVVSA